MAKMKLPAGIQGISGRLGKLHFRTLANGIVSVSIGEKRERTSQPTEKETQQRQRFAEVTQEWYCLSDVQRRDIYRDWEHNHREFNGKIYYTLRGYFIAKRLYELKHAADLLPIIIPHPVVITNKPS